MQLSDKAMKYLALLAKPGLFIAWAALCLWIATAHAEDAIATNGKDSIRIGA